MGRVFVFDSNGEGRVGFCELASGMSVVFAMWRLRKDKDKKKAGAVVFVLCDLDSADTIDLGEIEMALHEQP